jgi:hypothetical protein
LYRLPSAIEKLDALKQALRAQHPDLERHLLLEGEAPHHSKLLETGVVVRELLLELRGHILAVKRLRTSLGDFDATRGNAERAATRSDAASSAMSQGDSDVEAAAERITNSVFCLEGSDEGLGNDSDEEEHHRFLSEMEAMESSLDGLVSGEGEEGDELNVEDVEGEAYANATA